MSHDGVESFADVLNGFSLTGRRPARRPSTAEPQPGPVAAGEVWDDEQPEENASSVRAYAWTAGRTRSEFQLEIETLVSTSSRAYNLMPTLSMEHQAVAELCATSTSVAEVAALLSLPLGVVRVLLGDMAGLGLIDVHSNPSGEEPDLELLERVLRGLTNLRTTPAS